MLTFALSTIALAPPAALAPGSCSRVATGTRRCAAPTAIFEGLPPLDAVASLFGGLSSAVNEAAPSLPTGLNDLASNLATEASGLTPQGMALPTLPSADDISSWPSAASKLAGEELSAVATALADGANQLPAEVKADYVRALNLLPTLEAKQTELVEQLANVESLIEQAQPPVFPNDVGLLFGRDFVGPVATAVGLAASRTLDWRGSAKVPSTPFPTGRYDPKTSAQYHAAKPWEVARRLVETGLPASGWSVALLLDWLRGPASLEANARVRAEQLVTALTAMGPTYIKVGQALSIRADLLPPAYIAALTGLQDRVPAFESDLARSIMAKEWRLRDGGASAVNDLFESLSETPVAAASLGQVYKGVLRDGQLEVAIKVQRPEMEAKIALDLYLLRAAAIGVKKLRNLNSDLVGLVDDWGRGFVDELDYTREADNTRQFFESIADSPLAEVVTAPEVVEPLSTRRVLVTRWIDGERLERSQADDVSKLCGVALNTYLTMLLSTGLLHCDPHPGNLLRTTDGRLCILDWGLVTEVDEELQLTFLEHVAHLTAADYGKVPGDLIGLGFVPAGMEKNIADNPIVVETLAEVYSQWAGGGGVAKIDVNEVSSRLQQLTEDYGNFFQIPPYFAYILRAFSVLEGIALINDPDYSILNECLPYISQRVLTDASPRAKAALNSFVYESDDEALLAAAGGTGGTGGTGGRASSADGTHAGVSSSSSGLGGAAPLPVLDAPRLAKLADGFQSFSASAGGLSLDAEAQLERLAGQLVDLILAREGSPLQDLVLDEAARLADASVRDLVATTGGAVPAPLTGVLDPLGVLRGAAPLLDKYDEDERVLAAAATLSAPLLEALPSSSEGWQAVFSEEDAQGKLVRFVASRLWDRRSDVPVLTARLAGRVLLRGIDRVERLADGPSLATDDAPASRSLAATILTGGLAALSTGLVAVAPDATSGANEAAAAGSATTPSAERVGV